VSVRSFRIVTSPAGAVAKYCNERVCVSICLSASISSEPQARSLPIFVHVAYGRVSVLPRRGDAIIRGRANFGVFFPIDNALYKPYSGMNFATKDRKVGQNSISYY